MTTPKEALEQIAARSIAQNDDDAKELRRQLYHIASLAKSALASLEGDAVERVAQVLLDRFIERGKARSLSGVGTFRDGTKIIELPPSYRDDFEADARAILATGLVPDEAAVRADEREKCAATLLAVVSPDDESDVGERASVAFNNLDQRPMRERLAAWNGVLAAAIRSNRREA